MTAPSDVTTPTRILETCRSRACRRVVSDHRQHGSGITTAARARAADSYAGMFADTRVYGRQHAPAKVEWRFFLRTGPDGRKRDAADISATDRPMRSGRKAVLSHRRASLHSLDPGDQRVAPQLREASQRLLRPSAERPHIRRTASSGAEEQPVSGSVTHAATRRARDSRRRMGLPRMAVPRTLKIGPSPLNACAWGSACVRMRRPCHRWAHCRADQNPSSASASLLKISTYCRRPTIVSIF